MSSFPSDTCYVCGVCDNTILHQYPGGPKSLCFSCYKSLFPDTQHSSRVKKGKKFWGQTEVEQEFTKYFMSNCNKWLHQLIQQQKGSEKCCLIEWNITENQIVEILG